MQCSQPFQHHDTLVPIDRFDYRVGWRPDQIRQGDHQASISGDGGPYRGDRLLREAGDARHLSLRSSLRDPFGQLWVRDYLHSATLDLWVLGDLSASMRVTGASGPRRTDPLQCIADLIRSAAHSAKAVGDRLGVFCAAAGSLPQSCAPAGRSMAAALTIADRLDSPALLSQETPDNKQALASARGLMQAAAWIGPRQALVFLVSDFQQPLEQWGRLLSVLSRHQVIPVVTWSLPDLVLMRRSGLVTVQDAESGRTRVLWVRKRLRESIGNRLDQHFDSINSLCRAHGCRPIHLFDGFDTTRFTRYFHGAGQTECRPTSRIR